MSSHVLVKHPLQGTPVERSEQGSSEWGDEVAAADLRGSAPTAGAREQARLAADRFLLFRDHLTDLALWAGGESCRLEGWIPQALFGMHLRSDKYPHVPCTQKATFVTRHDGKPWHLC